jgi:predicted AlkP superfamily phosphohydrolase/phosphomutase
MSFHILEDPSNGITDVFLSHSTLTDIDPMIWQDEDFDWEDNTELSLDTTKEKIFSILHNPILLSKYFDSPEMLYVVSKNQLEITDYYDLVQRYITEFCEFIDQDYAIYFKVNS